jgi:hypothetical protein
LARGLGIVGLSDTARHLEAQPGEEEFTINFSRWQTFRLSPGLFTKPLGCTSPMSAFDRSIDVPDPFFPDYAHTACLLSSDEREEKVSRTQ